MDIMDLYKSLIKVSQGRPVKQDIPQLNASHFVLASEHLVTNSAAQRHTNESGHREVNVPGAKQRVLKRMTPGK